MAGADKNRTDLAGKIAKHADLSVNAVLRVFYALLDHGIDVLEAKLAISTPTPTPTPTTETQSPNESKVKRSSKGVSVDQKVDGG
jgi:hypothetical protein